MQKESSVADVAKSALSALRSQKAKAGKVIQKAYRPIKSISPVAIGGGLAAGHIAGGYSGSAAAQASMYHLGYDDAMKKQAGVAEFVRSGISGARGFVTRTGNTARSSALAKRVGGAVRANPMKSTAIAAGTGLAAGGMMKSSGLYSRALAFARLKGRTNPLATKIVAGTAAGGLGLGVTHVADEHLDGAAGRAAVYNYRKQNGSI